MEIRFTRHARLRISQRSLTPEDVDSVLTRPDDVWVGATAVEYDAVVRGLPLRVVVVRDSDPPLVITVMVRDLE